jgi:hypothetical protein
MTTSITLVRRRWNRIGVEAEEPQQQKRLQVELSQMEMPQSLPKDFADWLSPTADTHPAWQGNSQKRYSIPPTTPVISPLSLDLLDTRKLIPCPGVMQGDSSAWLHLGQMHILPMQIKQPATHIPSIIVQHFTIVPLHHN